MNLAYLNKIIDSFFKIGSKIEIQNKMPENTNGDTNQNGQGQRDRSVQLSPNTQIVFTLKGFISTILTILGLFYGFYKLAIQPAIVSSESHYKEMLVEQEKRQYLKFDNLEEKIDRNFTLIESNHNRYRDLQNATPDNSGGSFGNESHSLNIMELDSTLFIDPILAENHQ